MIPGCCSTFIRPPINDNGWVCMVNRWVGALIGETVFGEYIFNPKNPLTLKSFNPKNVRQLMLPH